LAAGLAIGLLAWAGIARADDTFRLNLTPQTEGGTQTLGLVDQEADTIPVASRGFGGSRGSVSFARTGGGFAASRSSASFARTGGGFATFNRSAVAFRTFPRSTVAVRGFPRSTFVVRSFPRSTVFVGGFNRSVVVSRGFFRPYGFGIGSPWFGWGFPAFPSWYNSINYWPWVNVAPTVFYSPYLDCSINSVSGSVGSLTDLAPGAYDADPYLTLPPTSLNPASNLPMPRVTPPNAGDGTFPYDGGPKAPAPMPREELQPRGAPPSTFTLEGRPVSLPARGAKWTYPAYGEQPKRVTPVEDRSIVIMR
jgi:hypothetical protein